MKTTKLLEIMKGALDKEMKKRDIPIEFSIVNDTTHTGKPTPTLQMTSLHPDDKDYTYKCRYVIRHHELAGICANDSTWLKSE